VFGSVQNGNFDPDDCIVFAVSLFRVQNWQGYSGLPIDKKGLGFHSISYSCFENDLRAIVDLVVDRLGHKGIQTTGT